MSIKAYASSDSDSKFEVIDYDPGDLGVNEVEIDVSYCGLCHSDLSMLNNDWGMTEYPLVAGHEIAGTVAAAGDAVSHLKVGQRVGLGWNCGSCQTCEQCLSGNHNLCASSQGTIVGHHGGFANKVRAQALWTLPIPDALDLSAVGPLFCGGITVFNPIVQNQISPTDRVGVVGIGGLGHLALQFLNKWGCEVTAFSTSPEKEDDAKKLGAHQFINSRDDGAMKKAANHFDMILVTVNVELDWDKYIAALRPKGTLHLVGAAPQVQSAVFPLLSGQKSIGASPIGSPSTALRMVEFAARHGIAPRTEILPMSRIDEAFKKLEEEQPAHRIVLKNDFD